MASIGLLLNYNRTQLLTIYLNAVDIQLNMMTTKSLNEIKIPDIAHYLQRILWDVYYMFFRIHSEKNANNILSLYEDFIIDGVVSSVKNFCTLLEEDHKNTDTDNSQTSHLNLDNINNANNANDSYIENDLKRFDKWLEQLKLRISSKCNQILEQLHSASEIAKLQQLVYNVSTSNMNMSSNDTVNEKIYQDFELKHPSIVNLSHTDYNTAYSYLLNPKIRNRGRSIKGNNANNKDIWELFFLNSFQQQILKMLQRTCESSILKLQSFLTFDLLFPSSTSKSQQHIFKSELTSKQLFYEAENLFIRIQTEFKSLFEASLFGGSSVDIFCFGLYVVATHLASNLLILLRCAISTITTNMKNISPSDPKYKPCLSSLLLISRLGYVMVTRFDFFSNLFIDANFSRFDGETNLPWNAFNCYSYLDDVSIKSAFEIADANGDGLLSFIEYKEALSALGNTSISEEKFNSVTLLEFSLLCSHFSLVKVHDTLSKLKMGMSTLIIFSQTLWSEMVCKNLLTTHLSDLSYLKIESHDDTNNSYEVDNNNYQKSPSQHLSINSMSRTLIKFLYMLSHQFYTNFVSIDTVHAIKKSVYDDYSNSDVLDSYFVNLLSKHSLKKDSLKNIFNSGLLDSAVSSLIYEAISIVINHLNSNQDSLLNHGLTKSINEEMCLQMIFDMMSLEFIIKNISSKAIGNNFSDLLISIRARKSQLQMHLSADGKVIVAKEFESRVNNHFKKTSLLLGIFSPTNSHLNSYQSITDKESSSSTGAVDQRDQALQHVFSSYKCNTRFSLLPLPLRY